MENGNADLNINSKIIILILILITLIATPTHEFGHLLGFKLSGIPAKYGFISTQSLNGSESLLAYLGGPLISLLLSLAGCTIVYIFRKKKNVFIAVYFTITMCLSRLLPYLLCMIFGAKDMSINDEGLIATSLSLPVWSAYAFFIILFISILLVLRLVHKDYFNKYFKFAFLLYFVIMILFQINAY